MCRPVSQTVSGSSQERSGWVAEGSGRWGAADKDVDTGGGAVSGVGVEAEGLEGVGQGKGQVEPIEYLAGMLRRRKHVDEGADETPGDDGREDVDGRGLRAVAGQNKTSVGGPAAGEGLFEVGKFLGSGEELVVVLARGAGQFRGSFWDGGLRNFGFEYWRFGGWRAAAVVLGRGSAYGLSRLAEVEGVDCSLEEALGVFLEGGEGFFAAAGRLMRAGETDGGVDGFGFDEVGEAAQRIQRGEPRAERDAQGGA